MVLYRNDVGGGAKKRTSLRPQNYIPRGETDGRTKGRADPFAATVSLRSSSEDTGAAAARREFDLHLEKMALGQRRRLARHLTYMHHTHSRRYRWRCSMQSSSCSAASKNMLIRVSIISYQEVSTFDGPPGILVAPIVGHRLTMLVFTNRQVRNRLLISAFHIKTPSLLSHCLFHLPLHPPPFICYSPPGNLSVWINYATLSLPLPTQPPLILQFCLRGFASHSPPH